MYVPYFNDSFRRCLVPQFPILINIILIAYITKYKMAGGIIAACHNNDSASLNLIGGLAIMA
jgi:hypothetical protein